MTATGPLTDPRLVPLRLQPAVDQQKPVRLPLGCLQGVYSAPEAHPDHPDHPVIEKVKRGWPTEAKQARDEVIT